MAEIIGATENVPRADLFYQRLPILLYLRKEHINGIIIAIIE